MSREGGGGGGGDVARRSGREIGGGGGGPGQEAARDGGGGGRHEGRGTGQDQKLTSGSKVGDQKWTSESRLAGARMLYQGSVQAVRGGDPATGGGAGRGAGGGLRPISAPMVGRGAEEVNSSP